MAAAKLVGELLRERVLSGNAGGCSPNARRTAYLRARIASSRASKFSSPSDHSSLRSTGRARSIAFHPTEQLLDVFAGLCVIFLQVGGDRHPLAERMLYRMVGGIKWIRRGARRQQAAVAGEEIFEAEIGGEVAGGAAMPSS